MIKKNGAKFAIKNLKGKIRLIFFLVIIKNFPAMHPL